MAGLTPEELLQIHKDYADEFARMASSALQGAFSALSNADIYRYQPALIRIDSPDVGTPKDPPTAPKPPGPIKPLKLGKIDSFKDIPSPGFGSAPTVPGYLQTAPTYIAPVKPGTAPPFTLTPPTLPPAPTMPGVPAFIPLPALYLPYPTVNIPTAPVITDPIFEGQRPDEMQAVEPQTIIDAYTTEQDEHRNLLPTYATTQADALITKYVPEYDDLRGRINAFVMSYTDPTSGGGTGVPANIEGAILARASEKNAAEFQRAVDTAAVALAKNGFSIPPGAMLATLRQSRMAMGNAQVGANTDIATKNFELEQKNFEFVLKMGQALEEKMMDTITKYLELSLKMDELSIMSAKEIVAAYLGAYNIQVLVYKALWDGYQTDAAVFKARIDAMRARVDVYEAEIKAELAKTEVNTAYVGILQAIATVNTAIANQYESQVDAALAPIEYMKAIVSLYESQVRGFAAEVSVYESYWNAYRSEIDGELGKFKAFESQAQGYAAQVSGYKAQADGYTAQVSGYAAANQAIASQNESVIKEYTVQSEIEIKNFETALALFGTESNVRVEQMKIEIEYWRAKGGFIMSEWNVTVQQQFEFAREQMNLFRGQMESAINAGQGLAQAAGVAGSLAGGAMQGLTSFAGNLVNSNQ